jgi:D-3-phosphoglycerate dehydrogenase
LINLAKMSDVVSVHVAATDDTENLIDAGFLQAMKKGATLINTSRGSVVDSAALAKAVREKSLKAGLDVYAKQPGPNDTTFADPIVRESCVYGTHHNGASTDQAQAAIAAETVRIVKNYLDSGQVAHCVNRAKTSPATTLLTVRHLNRPGVLRDVFDIIGQASINVEEMENIIYEGAAAACARIHLDGPLAESEIAAISRNTNVLSVTQSPVQR